MVFRGGPAGGVETVVDGSAKEGLAPMQLLLLSVAGCMAIDIRMILEKSRVPLTGLEIDAVGARADEPPRRYERVELVCHVQGPRPEDAEKVRRAVELSRDTYCSVLHTLDPEMKIEVRVADGGEA